MKRYELAKKAGLNWQVVLIEDLQTDLKLLIRDYVKNNRLFAELNREINRMIEEAVNELDSNELKAMVRTSMPLFASKIYIKTAALFATTQATATVIALAKARNVKVPQTVKQALIQRLEELPESEHIDYNRAVPNMINPKEYQKEVERRMNEIADSVAKTDYSANTSLRASAERQIRWEWHEKTIQGYIDNGIDLIWINSHANCSERCQKWQGKLYSISGKSGSIDGVPYQPLSNATDIYYTTKAGKTWKNGCLSGFGCRHETVVYRKNFKPTPISDSVIKREREIEQTQRAMEREIRKAECRALYYKGDRAMREAYQFYKDKAKVLTNKYIKYSHDNGVAYYPSRIDI